MMVSPEMLGAMNQGALDREVAKWDQLDTLVNPEHPTFPEYERLRVNALSIISRMSLTFTMPSGGPELFEKQAEEIADLYRQAEAIRSQMVSDGMRTTLSVPDGTAFDTELENRIDAATDALGDQGAPIRDRLIQIARGLGTKASDVREGDTDGNFFFFPSGPAAGMVNFDKVAEAEKFLASVKTTAGVTPELAELASQLEKGVRNIRAIDPVRETGFNRWQALRESKKGIGGETKFFRFFGTLVGGLISTLGLGHNAWQIFKGQTPSVNVATVGWGLLTAFSINPKLFQGGADRALEQVAAVGSQDIRKLVGAGFSGDDGRAALDELQELRGSQGALLRTLGKSETLTVVQVSELSDSKPLIRVLTKLPENMRPLALRTMSARMNDTQLELLKNLM